MKNDIFKIWVKPEQIRENQSGAFFGIIYFQINGYFFPEKDWEDFPINVLSAIAEKSLELLERVKSIEVLFLEGNFFKVRVSQLGDICKIECLQGEEKAGIPEKVMEKAEVMIRDYIEEVARACATILAGAGNVKKFKRQYEYEELKELHSLLTNALEETNKKLY